MAVFTTNSNESEDQHSAGKSILLHLLPGVIIGTVYFALRVPLAKYGYPSYMSLAIAVIVALIPLELGFLLFTGYRKNGKLSLDGVVLYRNKIPLWNYFVYVPVMFLIMGPIFIGFKPVAQFLQSSLFSWVPDMQTGLVAGYSRSVLIQTYILIAIFVVIIGPIVEELYFRGYLLPRMKYAGKFAIALNSFLFALYHVFSPWMLVTRAIGIIPIAFAAKRKNIYLGMIVHVLANSLDVIAACIFIASM